MNCMRTIAFSAALVTCTAASAAVRRAEVTTDLHMRAGPGTRYRIVRTIPDGGDVRLYGCVRGRDWCDIAWHGSRGWVSSHYIDIYYRNRYRPLPSFGATIGVPTLSFSFGNYADRHYRDMPWYHGGGHDQAHRDYHRRGNGGHHSAAGDHHDRYDHNRRTGHDYCRPGDNTCSSDQRSYDQWGDNARHYDRYRGDHAG